MPELGETRDVLIGPRRKHQAHRWNRGLGHAAPPEDGVNQRAAGSSVAIGEWMDGLELCVGQRSLDQGRVLVTVDVGDQVRQEFANSLWWRRDE